MAAGPSPRERAEAAPAPLPLPAAPAFCIALQRRSFELSPPAGDLLRGAQRMHPFSRRLTVPIFIWSPPCHWEGKGRVPRPAPGKLTIIWREGEAWAAYGKEPEWPLASLCLPAPRCGLLQPPTAALPAEPSSKGRFGLGSGGWTFTLEAASPTPYPADRSLQVSTEHFRSRLLQSLWWGKCGLTEV